jgi:aldehyde:ferredoxin oxidoreductase
MRFGYMGKVLWVNLTTGKMEDVIIKDKDYEEYFSGYGLGAKMLFQNQKAGCDPLGPDNILGIMSGLMTGTYAPFSGRWMAMAKSPITGGWGDANCGGTFGMAIKATGYDGFFFSGISREPVYLLINGGKVSIEDAKDMWGQSTFFTNNYLNEKYGRTFRIASIGQAGEHCSLISGIITDNGRAAARSGLGAVMGSKKLKAICIAGNEDVKIKNKDEFLSGIHQFIKSFRKFKHPVINFFIGCMMNIPFLSNLIIYLMNTTSKKTGEPLINSIEPSDFERYVMEKWGTPSIVSSSAESGDSPVKNWNGAGCEDFKPEKASKISNDYVKRNEDARFHCFSCPLGCGSTLNKTENGVTRKAFIPEYETICGFGTMVLCNDIKTIIEINDLLNGAGLDTISTAVTVSWAYEAYNRNHITKEDTDGLELIWGNSDALLKLVKLIVNNEGFGKNLLNGVKKAVEYFSQKKPGINFNEYAMHVGGQELPMHDPRSNGGLGLGVAYETEPTPGRHTSTLGGVASLYEANSNKNLKTLSVNNNTKKIKKRHTMSVKAVNPEGDELLKDSCFMDLVNGLGYCAFGFDNGITLPFIDWLNLTSGWDKDFESYMFTARRIKTLRHSFSVREKLADSKSKAEFIEKIMVKMPDRVRNNQLKNGPNANVSNDFDKGKAEYYTAMGYDPETAMPSKKILKELELDYVMDEIYPLYEKLE